MFLQKQLGNILLYEQVLFLLGNTQIIYHFMEDILAKNKSRALYIRTVGHTTTLSWSVMELSLKDIFPYSKESDNEIIKDLWRWYAAKSETFRRKSSEQD